MTDLYRFYDATDQLLYVGISLSAIQRAEQHKHEKSWWGDVSRMAVERFDSRQAAAEAEREAIKSERPLHNVVHNGQPQKRNRPQRSGHPLDPGGARWQKGWVYAFGLDDGECPVGIVTDIWTPDEAFPFTTLEVVLYNWIIGLFDGPTITISAESIVRSCKAERDPDERGGWVFQMDALADFQTRWIRSHREVVA